MATISADKTPGFIPVSEWPNLESLAVGFHEHLMAESHKFSGDSLTIILADADRTCITHNFSNAQTLEWEVRQTKQSGTAQYKAFEVRPGIFFIDFYKPDYEEQVSLLINLTSGQGIVGISGVHVREDGQKRTWTKFTDASIEGCKSATPFEPTAELIGKHILYRYTPRDAYEHVYLNQGTFTWHCLSGTEKGIADTEPCKMLKLDDELYLLFWAEKVMPVESIVIVDLKHMRSTGRFFCWDPKPASLVHMSFGSYATVLAETDAAKMVETEKAHI
ncbi:Molybdenum cofactor biosynthesis protein F [Penicillium italicum]|uniref:Molybdenum cofactor biosynthesis protein F n=1 Tax=Penicillium italicum TaxID=40296 RepID=A0A0A2L5T9_PENIT|nr:Molybdenum cofactor biosynthesis protein F [Penicillium italicum]